MLLAGKQRVRPANKQFLMKFSIRIAVLMAKTSKYSMCWQHMYSAQLKGLRRLHNKQE